MSQYTRLPMAPSPLPSPLAVGNGLGTPNPTDIRQAHRGGLPRTSVPAAVDPGFRARHGVTSVGSCLVTTLPGGRGGGIRHAEGAHRHASVATYTRLTRAGFTP